jgi:hypothetical protein
MQNAIRITRGWTAGALVAVLVLAAAGVSQASVIVPLSQSSSGGVPASYLDALLTFDVSGTTLTLTMTNQTTNPPESFYINKIFFNATSDVTGLTLTSAPAGWSLGFKEDTYRTGGFGRFDAALIGSVGDHPGQIAPGEMTIFTMDMVGPGPFTALDFATETSVSSRGGIASLVAAKFVRGTQCDDSAYGNATTATPPVIPEPATVAFLALGVVAVMARRLGNVRRARPCL